MISTSFSGTQEYMAMEKLSTLAATGQFDLIVVDTPPSRSALDFLDAPQRLSSFMDGRMIKLLATPSRGVMKIVGAGFALFSKAVTTILGGQMLQDAAQFVQLFEDMFGGFRQRAQATYELLRAPGHQVRRGRRSARRIRCARRRISPTGCGPNTCRWPGWS